jgi:hypothetical protein
MKTSVAGLMALVVSGCATAGQPVSQVHVGPLSGVGRQVAFDHGCPEERIMVIRSDVPTVDLDVCGVVRRYKSVAGGASSSSTDTWLDVTSSYPPSALPAPLPTK